MTALLILVVVGSTIWVVADAFQTGRRGADVAAWTILCLLLWIVAFPVYLVKQRSYAAEASAVGNDWDGYRRGKRRR